VGAAIAAAWAAFVANQQNKRLTERKLRFQSRIEVKGPTSAQVILTVSNDSFRPVSLVNVGFMPSGDLAVINRDDVIDGTTLPVTLQDGEAGEWSFDADKLIGAVAQPIGGCRWFLADTRGRELC
jgi:hypothetical protein